jgi:hypothetical protein
MLSATPTGLGPIALTHTQRPGSTVGNSLLPRLTDKYTSNRAASTSSLSGPLGVLLRDVRHYATGQRERTARQWTSTLHERGRPHLNAAHLASCTWPNRSRRFPTQERSNDRTSRNMHLAGCQVHEPPKTSTTRFVNSSAAGFRPSRVSRQLRRSFYADRQCPCRTSS